MKTLSPRRVAGADVGAAAADANRCVRALRRSKRGSYFFARFDKHAVF